MLNAQNKHIIVDFLLKFNMDKRFQMNLQLSIGTSK